MNCENYSELITGYVDGELMDAEVALLLSHLNDCTRCYKYFEDINGVKDLLKRYAATKVLSPSLGFSQKIMRSVQRGIPNSRKKIFWRFSLQPSITWVAAAMIVVMLFAGILYLRTSVQKPSESTYYAGTISLPSGNAENADFNNIEDYLYQHAMEVSRTPLTDNTVFVGYMDR